MFGSEAAPQQAASSANRLNRIVATPHRPTTSELHVKSATDTKVFLGHGHDYAANGHGGNVVLKSRERSDYQVSILEVACSLDSDGDVLALESRWKGKLQSRAMGFNAN